MLFSATIPEDIKKLCDKYMSSPDLIEVESDSSALDRIDQLRFDIDERDKFDLLRDLTIVENPDTCMLFCNTRILVDELYESLKRLGYPCGRIHGGMAQRDRMREMDSFKKGKFRYLIATGVAARGIDVDNVSLVVNYDIPEDAESYVHRVGRTGRKGLRGRALSFITDRDDEFIKEIEQYIGKEVAVGEFPTEEQVELAMPAFEEKINTRPEKKVAKSAKLDQDILKIHINAGKKQKMRAADIVGTLCNINGMTKDDIGIINIMDISTYVEVLHGKGSMVLNVLQKKPLKGRIRKVNKADDELFPGERRARRGRDFEAKNQRERKDGRDRHSDRNRSNNRNNSWKKD